MYKATPNLFEPAPPSGISTPIYKNNIDYWYIPYDGIVSNDSSFVVLPYSSVVDISKLQSPMTTVSIIEYSYVKIYLNNSLIYSESGSNINQIEINLNGTGSLEIEYGIYCIANSGSPIEADYYSLGAKYLIGIAKNTYPLKRITCADAVNRVLALTEPLQLWQKPRFTLDERTAAKLDKIYSPELTLTRATLRECLQQIGQISHAEPRLSEYDGTSGIITYDFYGSKKRSFAKNLPYISKTAKHAIEQYCTSIDSTAENLSNELDWVSSTVVEPYTSGYKTVRTEQQYIRITDGNMIIQTAYPIMKVIKLECGIVPNNTSITYADITPYVFESTLYNSQLSAYLGNYPYSKAYGVYYTQGQKNIQGLNFKPDDDSPIFPAFGNYSIVNILEAATGQTLSQVDYPQLAFRVTYVPFFNVRVGQSKPYYKDAETPAAIAYNQSANVIESRYYGENIKGEVARLGNVEKSITYVCAWFDQIPKAGELYDDEYYISAVSWEVLPTYIKCTLGLSKDFNRISQYIGISSNRRYYEVSERQAYDRSTLYREYIVIGDKAKETGSAVSDLSLRVMAALVWQFNTPFVQTSPTEKPSFYEQGKVSNVFAWGGTYSNPQFVQVNDTTYTALPLVNLPVVACALGNAMVFIWNYKDNYSAGDTSTYASTGSVSGYFQGDYQYTDYYGKMYYYTFSLAANGTVPTNLTEQTNIGGELPGSDITSVSDIPTDCWSSCYVYRKDNREIPQFNASIEFVTNRKGYIIGSAMAARNSLVYTNGTDWWQSGGLTNKFAKLYILQEPLSKFTYGLSADGIDLTDSAQATEIEYTVSYKPNGSFYINGFTIPTACKAWAFVTPMQTYTETVEDEEGNVSTQTYQKGGELLFGCNGDFEAGQVVEDIYMTPVHDIYKNALPGMKESVTFTVSLSAGSGSGESGGGTVEMSLDAKATELETLSYTVPKGMTFAQFIKSKYNDGKFGIGANDRVIFSDGTNAWELKDYSGGGPLVQVATGNILIETVPWNTAAVRVSSSSGGTYPFFLDDTLSDQEKYYVVKNYYMGISDPVLRFSLFAEDTAVESYMGTFYNTLYNLLLANAENA